MALMLFLTLTIDKNVVKVKNHKLTNVRPKHLVHKPDESAKDIGQIEWHHKPLIQTPFGLDCYFSLITLSNAIFHSLNAH